MGYLPHFTISHTTQSNAVAGHRRKSNDTLIQPPGDIQFAWPGKKNNLESQNQHCARRL